MGLVCHPAVIASIVMRSLQSSVRSGNSKSAPIANISLQRGVDGASAAE
jgi:hypothetical protein